MQKSIFLILILALIIIGGVIILFLSLFFEADPAVNFNDPVVDYTNGGNKNINTAANNNINDNLPVKIYHINGTIKRIEEDRMFVDAIVLTGKTLKPNQEGKTEIVEVVISTTVKITKLTFVAKEGTRGKIYTPNIVDIKLSDLKIGDKVEVVSSSDIKGKDSFTAATIQLTQTSIK
ncbi:hypothetical protein KAS41_02475 [Candidatus Parcubacteria bacterium]|nr:hypothetical protein [Candidatus Parcubacteria bacterium]